MGPTPTIATLHLQCKITLMISKCPRCYVDPTHVTNPTRARRASLGARLVVSALDCTLGSGWRMKIIGAISHEKREAVLSA